MVQESWNHEVFLKSCPRHHTRLPGFKRRVNELPTIYVDGQSIGNEQRVQPRAAKIAFVYQTSDSGPPTRDSKVYFKDIGNKTNNEAEYHALLAALSFISRNLAGKGPDVRNVRTCSDSKLLVNQVNGDWKIETERLKQLREKAAIVVAQLGLRRLVWVPRDQNYAGLWKHAANLLLGATIEPDRQGGKLAFGPGRSCRGKLVVRVRAGLRRARRPEGPVGFQPRNRRPDTQQRGTRVLQETRHHIRRANAVNRRIIRSDSPEQAKARRTNCRRQYSIRPEGLASLHSRTRTQPHLRGSIPCSLRPISLGGKGARYPRPTGLEGERRCIRWFSRRVCQDSGAYTQHVLTR